MKQPIRESQFPAALAFIAAVLPFPIVWAVCVVLGRALVIGFLDGVMKYLHGLPWFDEVLMCAAIGLPVIPAYWVSRATYMNVRWSKVEYDGSSCRQCGYDLTGNVSGVCPECGTKL
ncbi:MAG TPA: hypothetical protein PKN33_09945 [Phycisphaerae bacterium]|nr:hypothetical protein [Phycisphaerae bacterium]